MTKRPLLPVQVVRSFLRALATRDYEAAHALLSPDCEIESGVGAKVRGSENARLFLSNVHGASLENEFEVRREITAGVVVVNERIDRRRLEAGWCEWRAAGVWEVHDGRITLWRDYFDGAALAQAVLRPPAGRPDYSTS
jgi:limonene-1,2-epoxide hydrolase